MRRRPWLWLSIALVAFGCAAWLMTCGEVHEVPPWSRTTKRVDFPRSMRSQEYVRQRDRRRPLARPVVPPEEGDGRLPIDDPVLRALPPLGRGAVIVVEANALRHSPLGELFVDCMNRRDHEWLDDVQEDWGVNLLEDLDRVAVSDDVLMLAGHFGAAEWAEIFGDRQRESYGDAVIYSAEGADGVPTTSAGWAIWNDELVLTAQSREGLEAAIDRLDGRARAVPPIGEEQTYGEVYGVLSADAIAALLTADQAEMADALREVVDRIELHVDATSDVAMVAAFQGHESDRLTDLAKSIGAALAVARMTAASQGDEELAELLGFARIQASDGSFNLELALPQALLAEHLRAVCDAQQRVSEPLEPTLDTLGASGK